MGKNKSKKWLLAFFALILLFFSACTDHKIDRDELLTFHRKNISPYILPEKIVQNWHIYLDNHQSTKTIWTNLPENTADLLAELQSQEAHFWTSQKKISWQVFKKKPVYDSISYLKNTVEKICSQNQAAILISHFEYFDTEKKFKAILQNGDTVWTHLNPYPWASASFKKWFEKGNRIEIWLSEVPKKTYTLFFVPKNQEIDPKIQAFAPEKRFCFSPSLFLEKKYEKYTGASSQSVDFQEIDQKIEYYLFKKSDIFLKNFIQHNFLYLNGLALKNIPLRCKLSNFTESYYYYQQHRQSQSGGFRVDTQTGDTLFLPSDLGFYFLGGKQDSIFGATWDTTKMEMQVFWQKKDDFELQEEKNNLFLLQIYADHVPVFFDEKLKKDLQSLHPQGFRIESLYKSLELALPKNIEGGLLKSYYLHILE